MKFQLATIDSGSGPSAALIVGDKVVEVAAATGREADRSMLALISGWDANLPRLEAVAAKADSLGAPLASAKLLAPITDPGGIFCVGANYSDHVAEMAAQAGRPIADPKAIGVRSWQFLKTRHCLTGTNSIVAMHPRAKKIDWEAELAVVIGKKAFQVSEEDALDYVLGYTIANDLSARDLNKRDQLPDVNPFKFDWVAHKNWDGSCPLGPAITLARDVADPQDLDITLEVNGVVKQQSNSSRMIFNIREQIADLSRNFTLWPGDVILTGTPAGVGAGRGEFLNKGDVIRIRIEGLGELVNTMG
ncbi:MAG TPA: fumarylacetoacetate hydrolase family protein [Caulobacteraceae bacterium]|jgi:2-keto-4-pentenoate hydratase/2-oxohepta-3-ene-1,7-dioic acid hydratase in catechol pathway|nr:fumarylacetoacetate hydrolase family protein [Caulobacteraceae bacterium]